MPCEHADVHIHVNHHRSGDTNVAYLEVTANCTGCGNNFVFPGMAMGSSPERPMVNPDHTEIRIPMIPMGESVTGNPAGFTIAVDKGTVQ